MRSRMSTVEKASTDRRDGPRHPVEIARGVVPEQLVEDALRLLHQSFNDIPLLFGTRCAKTSARDPSAP